MGLARTPLEPWTQFKLCRWLHIFLQFTCLDGKVHRQQALPMNQDPTLQIIHTTPSRTKWISSSELSFFMIANNFRNEWARTMLGVKRIHQWTSLILLSLMRILAMED